MTGRTKKRIAQSKRVRAGSLAIVDQPRVARTCILRAFGLQTSCRLSLVLRVFCFRILAFTDAAALFVQSVFVLRYTCAPTATRSYLTTVCALFCFCSFLFCFFGDVRVLFVPLPFSLCMESTSYVFSFRVVFFYLVTTGWMFYISAYVGIHSINQSISINSKLA